MQAKGGDKKREDEQNYSECRNPQEVCLMEYLTYLNTWNQIKVRRICYEKGMCIRHVYPVVFRCHER
jgi:hypothetical protein